MSKVEYKIPLCCQIIMYLQFYLSTGRINSSTSNITSQPTWTLTSLLPEPANPQRIPIALHSHTLKITTPTSERYLWISDQNSIQCSLWNCWKSENSLGWCITLTIRPQSRHFGLADTIPPICCWTLGPHRAVGSPRFHSQCMTAGFQSQTQTELILKNTDNTSIIFGGSQQSYRVAQRPIFCNENKELIVEKRGQICSPAYIGRSESERVNNFRFMGVTIKDNLSYWPCSESTEMTVLLKDTGAGMPCCCKLLHSNNRKLVG